MSSSSDSQNAADSSMAVIPPKKIYFDRKYFHQDWSLPDSIIYYITQNPYSAEFYLNLISTCKYFFARHPILLCPGLGFDGKTYKDRSEVLKEHPPCNIMEFPVKYWIVCCHFGVFPSKTSNLTNEASSCIKNIYRCEAERLYFVNQIISLNELLFVSSSVYAIHFDQVTVKNKDGSVLPLEKIIEAIPKLKEIYYQTGSFFSNVTSNTFKELLKIPHFSQMEQFTIDGIPEAFDLDTFYAYMKKNKVTKFDLKFNNSISEEYKNRLEEIIDEIIATKDLQYKPPFILFAGLDEIKLNALRKIYWRL